MAADTLALQILLQRRVQSPLILGAALYAADGALLVEAGVSPPDSPDGYFGRSAVPGTGKLVNTGRYSYVSPVVFQDITASLSDGQHRSLTARAGYPRHAAFPVVSAIPRPRSA